MALNGGSRPDLFPAAGAAPKALARQDRRSPDHPGLSPPGSSSRTSLGPIPGTLPMSLVDLEGGSAKTPLPGRWWSASPPMRLRLRQAGHLRRCEVSDTDLQQEQGTPRLASAGARPTISWPPWAPTSNAGFRRSLARVQRRPDAWTPGASWHIRLSVPLKAIRRMGARSPRTQQGPGLTPRPVGAKSVRSAQGGQRLRHPVSNYQDGGRHVRYFDAAGHAGARARAEVAEPLLRKAHGD